MKTGHSYKKSASAPFPESDIVRRVKRERINFGRSYAEYLTPSERIKVKKRNQLFKL